MHMLFLLRYVLQGLRFLGFLQSRLLDGPVPGHRGRSLSGQDLLLFSGPHVYRYLFSSTDRVLFDD